MSAILPVNTGTHAIATVGGQIKADLPELLIVLFGIFAINFVIRLLLDYLHGYRSGGAGGKNSLFDDDELWNPEAEQEKADEARQSRREDGLS